MNKGLEKGRTPIRVATAALALTVTAAIGIWSFRGDAEPQPQAASASTAVPEAEHGAEGIKITPEAAKEAGIVVSSLQVQPVPLAVRVPGEVIPNRYRSGVVTPRIAGIVVERLASVGDRVRKGQPLALMTSVEMAAAQGEYQIADQEWRRVRQLGKDIVSDKRFNETDIQRRQAMARLLGFGMNAKEIEALSAGGLPANAGQFALVAPQDGTVYSDDFVVGEMVEPGKVMFTVADGDSIWIDARVNAADAKKIRKGAPANVHVGEDSRQAVVGTTNPTMDEVTRTVSIRLEADNADGRLRPGMFVDVEIGTVDIPHALAVPTESVLRSPDGDWFVYTTNAEGAFVPAEIKVIRNAAGLSVIDGISAGLPVVTAGAFFVQSEASKGSMGADHH
ncbi:MAG: efflux RND transporter periplasmic adaptor subunit [Bacteroidota bacterium]